MGVQSADNSHKQAHFAYCSEIANVSTIRPNSDFQFWHNRLGHASVKVVNCMLNIVVNHIYL